LLMASANDAAYAIAETAGGSLDGFVAAMNQSAKRMGMKDSSFSDPAGLDDKTSFGGGPRMSAYDIAIATRNAMTVPEIAKWANMRTFSFVDPTGQHRSLTNHNKLLPGATRGYPWATGFKTGFTELAGHTLTATATRDGRSLIAVVLGTYDIYGWAAQLLDQGFATPSGAGTGVRLPRIGVSAYGRRVAEQQAFVTLLRGPDQRASEIPSTATDVTTTTAHTRSSVVDGNAIAAQQPATGKGGRGGSFVNAWTLTILLILVLLAAIVCRRRIVRRQRARRISQQRLRAAKMRSGGLTVVDGRYRSGNRVGPPVESHVRIRRADEERRQENG
jgi:D-alanyl-D-alanine carboxypeptidase